MLKKIFLCITLILCFSNVNAQVYRNGGDTWRINTFDGDPKFPYLIVTACYDPFTEHYEELSPSGESDCKPNIYEAKKRLRDMMETVVYLTERKYLVSMSMAVCHPHWFVIYLHTGKKYAEKEVYDKLWEKIKE